MNGSNPPSVTGSKNTLVSEITFEGKTKTKSRVVIVLVFLVLLFLAATAVFAGLFAHYYIQYDKKEPAIAPSAACNTPDCVISAAMMAKKMNLSADPCVDFSEYACGRFYREAILQEGRTRTGTFSVLSDENKLIMKDIIVEPVEAGQPNYLSNMKRLYKSCVNEAQIEEVGLQPFLNNTSFVNDWPTLNSGWSEGAFNLNAVIERYERVYIEPLFVYYVSSDMRNSSKKALYLSDPTLGLSQEYFSRPRNDSVIMAYQKYLAETAVALGADRTVAEVDARDVVNLEIELSKIMVPREEKRDSSKQYNLYTLEKLSIAYTDVDIPRALRAAFSTVNISLGSDQVLINRFPTYIGNISLVLNRFSNRIIQNLFGFKYALSKVSSLTRRMREIRLDFDKVYSGISSESPRWEVCLDSSSSAFWKAMSKQFVDRTFSEKAKAYMQEMIDNLEAVFEQMIKENTWMGEQTKEEAYSKLGTIKRKIGYPDFDFDVADIEEFYHNFTMNDGYYYGNRLLLSELSNIKGLLSLIEPIDKNEWHMSPFEVNAYYSRSENEIAFPAGILQSPFFSTTFQDSMNYGAIGVVIGHEITHGFDDQGSQYDADGNLRNWWQKEDRENFVQRTQCIVDQNSNFYVPEVQLNLNGINTQGESVADNGGVKESYRAYKELVRQKGERPPLPGLDLTQDQLFFLAYGQLWCEKMTNQRMITQVTTGVHPPGKYRILGPLQNSEDFAKAYKCSTGTYMNPERKCSVW